MYVGMALKMSVQNQSHMCATLRCNLLNHVPTTNMSYFGALVTIYIFPAKFQHLFDLHPVTRDFQRHTSSVFNVGETKKSTRYKCMWGWP